MKRLLYLFLIFVSISCEKDNMLNTSHNNEIFPLKVGNTWTYVDSLFMGSSGDVIVDTSILKIVSSGIFDTPEGEVELFNYTWYESHKQEFPNYSWLCRNSSNGFYEYGGMSNSVFLFDPSLVVKYPVEIGDTWNQVTFPAFPQFDSAFFVVGDTLSIECVGVRESFITPLQTFECYKYYNTVEPAWEGDIPNEYYNYYVPGIGRVGEIIERDGEIVHKRTLISYKL